jgi:hypothetical protein
VPGREVYPKLRVRQILGYFPFDFHGVLLSQVIDLKNNTPHNKQGQVPL